jgi:mRNA-degrading endonuclease RelE of RelBE toxin-antitoxin system
MLDVEFTPDLLKRIEKIKDSATKERLKKQIAKIVNYPEIGKPLRYDKKGTREVYISPFRLIYTYMKDENKLVLLDLYHKDEQ